MHAQTQASGREEAVNGQGSAREADGSRAGVGHGIERQDVLREN
jgi:hypothetical protein